MYKYVHSRDVHDPRWVARLTDWKLHFMYGRTPTSFFLLPPILISRLASLLRLFSHKNYATKARRKTSNLTRSGLFSTKGGFCVCGSKFSGHEPCRSKKLGKKVQKIKCGWYLRRMLLLSCETITCFLHYLINTEKILYYIWRLLRNFRKAACCKQESLGTVKNTFQIIR